MEQQKILIGAHTSAAGGSPNALHQGQEIGATTIQFFTSNQKQWNGRIITAEEVAQWEKLLDETGISQVMSHDSYLINLGSQKEELLEKSRNAFLGEIKRCHQLKVPYLNFHPGAATGATEEACIETIIASLLACEKEVQQGTTRLLLESTAGQGTSVGHRFEHLGTIIHEVRHKIPIGVCIDTCHIFVAGYDIRTLAGWEKTLAEFDEKIGLKYLMALHVNDSMKPLASKRDRHAQLGDGEIGIDSFKAMMQHPLLREIPKYLETPDPDFWEKEIKMLRDFAT